MLGYLKQLNSQVDGLTGTEFNYYDPSDPSKGQVRVTFDQEPLIGADPGHSVQSTNTECWGSQNQTIPAPMNGFLMANDEDATVMRTYNSTTIPVMYTLAQEFGLLDQYHADIWGPTQPNRLMFHACASHGYADNPDIKLIEGLPQRTIYNDLQDAGISWGIYYSDFPVTLILEQVRRYMLTHIHDLHRFLSDVQNGTLPTFSFIEPRWFDFLEWKENDQHPPSSSTYGEYLFKEVYEAVRASPIWNETLLIITYDEHGGLYDHVSPPQTGIPNPDGMVSLDPPYDFERLGLRVPFIGISPWIQKGTLLSAPPAGTYFSHSSTAATIRKMFQLPSPPLSMREAGAATYESIINLDAPRTDCPTTLPLPPSSDKAEWEAYIKAQRTVETPEAIEEMIQRRPDLHKDTTPITGLHRMIMQVAHSLTGGDTTQQVSEIESTWDGALYIRTQLKRFINALKQSENEN